MRIMFEGKIKRARKLQQERMPQASEDAPPLKDQMEKGDLFAMLLAAFVTFLPIIILVLGILAAAGYFFIVR